MSDSQRKWKPRRGVRTDSREHVTVLLTFVESKEANPINFIISISSSVLPSKSSSAKKEFLRSYYICGCTERYICVREKSSNRFAAFQPISTEDIKGEPIRNKKNCKPSSGGASL